MHLDVNTTTENNKKLVRTLVDEVWNRRNFDAVATLIGRDHVSHDPACAALGRGPGAYRDLVNLWAIAPGIRFAIDDLVAEGDRVAMRWTVTSGYNVKLTGMTIHWISGGKIVESWSNWDVAGLMNAMTSRERAARENAL